MKNSTKTKLIVPVLTGTLIVSGYTGVKYKLLEKENKQLKQELEKTNKKDNHVSYKTTVDEIKEINRKNVNLIVYESDYTKYKTELNDDSLFGINADVNTKFKYDVVVDLSKAKVEKIGDRILVSVDRDSIKLHDIEVKRVNLKYDLNLITRMRGDKIVEIESEILSRTYEDIDRLVKKDFTLNKELYELRLLEKLEKIYPYDVDIIFI